MSERKDQAVIGIQYLRGIAALFVVIDHTAVLMGMSQYLGRMPSQSLGFGRIGVDIFFVISGFIIALVSLREDLSPRLPLAEFLRRRFVRIVPFLWVCVFAYAGLRAVGRGSFETAPYLRAMFLWPLGEQRPNVVWTLRYEGLFYLVYGLSLLGAVRRPSLLVLWCLSPIVVEVVGRFVTISDATTIGALVHYVASPVNLEFGMGVVLGCLYVKRRQTPLLPMRPGPVLVTVAAVGVFVLAAILDLPALRSLASVVVLGLSSFIVVCFGIGARGEGRLSALAVLLGDASYSIYLTHKMLVLVLFDLMAHLHLSPNPYVAEVLVTLLVTAAGVAVHLFVEKPVVRAARSLFKPRPIAVPTSAA